MTEPSDASHERDVKLEEKPERIPAEVAVGETLEEVVEAVINKKYKEEEIETVIAVVLEAVVEEGSKVEHKRIRRLVEEMVENSLNEAAAKTPAKHKTSPRPNYQKMVLPPLSRSYKSWKGPQLREACRTRHLNTGGTNSELISRLSKWEKGQTYLGFTNTLTPRKHTKTTLPITPSRIRKRSVSKERNIPPHPSQKMRKIGAMDNEKWPPGTNIGCPTTPPNNMPGNEPGTGKKPVQVTQHRTQREARRSHAEHKGGKLGGTSQQKTIKEVLAKIKNRKNSPEDTTELAVKPERGGGPKDADKGVFKKPSQREKN